MVGRKTKKVDDKTGKDMIGQERNENNKSQKKKKKNIHKNIMERNRKINKYVKITRSQWFGQTGKKRENIRK